MVQLAIGMIETRGLCALLEASDAGAAAAAQVGQVISVQVIPRPHEGLAGLGKWLQQS
jgi:ethanolamine utilization protein EutM